MATKERYELVHGFRTNRAMGRGGLDLYGLGAVEDVSSDQSSWLGIKAYIQDILDTGNRISQVQQQLGKTVSALQGRLDKGEITQDTYDTILASLQPDIDKVNSDLAVWWKIEQSIKQWMPTWVANLEGTQLSGLGFLPIVLPVAAAAALGFVAVEGMRLLAQYKQNTNIVQQVASGKLAPDAAKVLMDTASSVSSVFSGAMNNLTLPIGLAIAGLLLIKFWPSRN